MSTPTRDQSAVPSLATTLPVALLCGAVHVAFYPPHRLGSLAFVGLAPFLETLVLASRDTPARALGRGALLGAAFGVVSVAGVIAWLPHALETANELSHRAAWLVYGAVVLFYTLGFSLFGAVAARAPRGRLPLWLVLPSAWVAMELLRNAAVPAIAWVQLGHSQHASLGVAQLAELAGVGGLSFLVVLVNVLILEALRATRRGDARAATRPVLALAVLAAVTLVWGATRMARQEAKPGQGRPVRVGIVQASVPQAQRWRPVLVPEHIAAHLRGTRVARRLGADLIVWPETSAELHLNDAPSLYSGIRDALDADASAHVIVGGPFAEPGPAQTRYTNSALLIDGAGTPLQRYDKIGLYPISETTPAWVSGSAWARRVFGAQLRWKPYSPGDRVAPLRAGALQAGILICFEAVGERAARERVEAGATLLVQLANDAIIPSPAAVEQHLAIVRMHAIALRRPIARAANGGVGAVISAAGRVLASVPSERAGVAVADLLPTNERTIFVRGGHGLGWLALATTLLGLLPRGRTRVRPTSCA